MYDDFERNHVIFYKFYKFWHFWYLCIVALPSILKDKDIEIDKRYWFAKIRKFLQNYVIRLIRLPDVISSGWGKLLLTLCESENKSVPPHRNVESGSATFTLKVLSNFTTERFNQFCTFYLLLCMYSTFIVRNVQHTCAQEAATRSRYGLEVYSDKY